MIRWTLSIAERFGSTADIPITDLIQTMAYDIQLVRQAHLTPQSFTDLSAEVLLLRGSKSPAFLRTTLDELNGALPCATQVEFDGLGHTGSENSGDPERVAQTLRHFFS